MSVYTPQTHNINTCSCVTPVPGVSCRYVRAVVLPCVEATRCLFRTRGSLPQDVVEVNEVFGMQISHSALRQKTLRIDVCNTSKSGHEECLVSRISCPGFTSC